jgi:hypothetical protein
MPPSGPRRRRARSSKTMRLKVTEPSLVQRSKPIQGIKLKTVSAITLVFALLCLASFMVGEAPFSPQSTARMSSLPWPRSREGYRRSNACGDASGAVTALGPGNPEASSQKVADK